MESIWTLVTILGPVLLIAAIVYAFIRSRSTSRREEIEGERGARELRHELEEDERG